MHEPPTLTFTPAAPDRWADIEAVIGACGDARLCWCAHWYRTAAEYAAGRRDGGNRAWLAARVAAGVAPGILAYLDERPVGWCGVAPRVEQVRLARSRNLAPVDDAAVWSITCFVVAREARRQGLMRALIAQAVAFAAERGAEIVEAYPLDVQRKARAAELYIGTLKAFLDQGFTEVARRSPTRPIVRRVLRGAPDAGAGSA